jgi:hypothetical protein
VRIATVTLTGIAALAALGGGLLERVASGQSGQREIPPAFANLEYLVGRWLGQGVPRESGAQQFRGWSETHTWAWVFSQGRPTGLSVTIERGKIFTSGRLTYNQARAVYRLEANGPKTDRGALVFEGTIDGSGKMLVLEQLGSTPAAVPSRAALKLTLRPNSNFVRYSMWVDRREPGAVAFSRWIDVGLTKEGETFAAGAATTERPRCIVTGGAATLTVDYEGRSFPVCCTGCRDEFRENPLKYLAKANRKGPAEPGETRGVAKAPARASRFEDAFSGDVLDAPGDPKRASRQDGPRPEATRDDAGSDRREDAKPADPRAKQRPPSKKSAAATPASPPASRAAALLQIGQNLEKSGKTDAALGYFRRIVKEYPATPAAKTAAQRLKAITSRQAPPHE